MICAWNELLGILPSKYRQCVDKQGKDVLQELRLRLGHPPQMVTNKGDFSLTGTVTQDDLSFVINAASRYSPWSAATSAQGYITAAGGHRVGICGEVTMNGDCCNGIRSIRSLCIRVARDFPGISESLDTDCGNILLIGPPGSGKTTFLRDLIRKWSNCRTGSVAVIDERGELFPKGMDTGIKTDILTGCGKTQGIAMALRTMGPAVIAVDEITEKHDCDALLQAAWCGVTLMATAHAGCVHDLKNRPVYRPLLESGLFSRVIVMKQDKSWHMERMEI